MKKPNNAPLLKTHSSTIAQRGWAYFRDGRVRQIEVQGNQRFGAVVQGERRYRVSISLNVHGEIIQSRCNCPYEDACKHTAALWYAVQDKDVLHAVACDEADLAELLAQCNDQKLRQWVLRMAAQCGEWRNALLLYLFEGKDPEQTQKIYRQQIGKLLENARDEYGGLDGVILADDVRDCLESIARQGDTALASALPLFLPALAEAMDETYNDEGNLYTCVEELVERLESLLSDGRLPEKQTAVLLDWVMAEWTKPAYHKYGGWDISLYRICVEYWQSGRYYDDWLDALERRLAYEKDGSYGATFYLREKWQVLRLSGQTDKAAEFFRQYLHLSDFRQIAVDQTIAEEDWEEAVRLLKRGIELDGQAGYRGNVYNWQKTLLTVYHKDGQYLSLRQLAKQLMWEGNRFREEHYRQWKETFTDAQWRSEREKLLEELRRAVKSKHRLAEVLCLAEVLVQEKQADELYRLLQQYPATNLLDRYAVFLNQTHAPELLRLYLHTLEKEVAQLNGRSQYQAFARRLKDLRHKHPQACLEVEYFASRVRQANLRRPALLDELTKAGFD